jgi:hypothetical protein
MPVLAGPAGDGGRAQLETAAGRPVRLADDEELIRHLGDTREQRNAEGSRAEKDDAPDAPH